MDKILWEQKKARFHQMMKVDTLYPEQCSDLDLQKETVDFYKLFFNYDLSAEEYNHFIHPVK